MRAPPFAYRTNEICHPHLHPPAGYDRPRARRWRRAVRAVAGGLARLRGPGAAKRERVRADKSVDGSAGYS